MKKFMLVVLALLVCSNSFAFSDPSIHKNIVSGRRIIATAGDELPLVSDDISCTKIIITALSSDTGVVCVGDKYVVAATATRQGIPLTAGQSITLPINSVNKVYIDSTANSDGVSFIYLQ